MSFLKKAAFVAAISALSVGAIADEAGFTAGAKLGKLMIDAEGMDDGDTAGVSLGYDFGNTWSVELDILRGDADGLDIDTTAVYGTYRSEGTVYFLGKLGFLKEELSANGYSDDDSGASYGIGGGYRITENFNIEAEFTIIESDVNLLGVGARFKF